MDAMVAQPYGIDEKTKLRDVSTAIITQEKILPDSFISWGTGNKSTNAKIGFNFKTAGIKAKHNSN